MATQQLNEVKITKSDKPRCPIHGQQDTEYKAQKAPCGCEWVWDEKTGKLVAQPGR